MIQVVNDSIAFAKEDIIAHQVNCRGVMGSGVAKLIRKKYPHVFSVYQRVCQAHAHNPSELLGKCQFCVTDDFDGRKVIVANLFAQDRYGRGQVFTDYAAFRQAMKNLSDKAFTARSKSIAIPYKIGCGRGGGDWEKVLAIISEELKDFNVILYYLKEDLQ